MRCLTLILGVLAAAFCASGQLAFPGAEGAGATATGGRGGSVYFVTNLNDSGVGSLRDAVSQPNRTIIFNVSGTINLLTDLKITRTNLTIAGQTAPGDGITLARRLTSVENTRNVIIRYLRCRPGDADTNFQDDAFHFVNATNCIADHISASWSVDECFSTTHSTNITVQWCLIAESLRNSQHNKGAHGYGTLLRYGQGQLSFHHNLYAHHDSRNPRLGDNLKLDFVNNTVFNWGGFCGYNGADSADNLSFGGMYFTNPANYVSNCFIAGPSTGSGRQSIAFDSGTTNAAQCQIFQSGNYMDSNKNAALDGSDTGWAMFSAPFTQLGVRFPLPNVSAEAPLVANQKVMAFAGASQVRDEVDHRILASVQSRTGRFVDAVGPTNQIADYVTNNINGTNYVFVRGWPALNSLAPAPDTDADGMPDFWEWNLGQNPALASNNLTNSSGYTHLELYLNWRAELDALGGVNQTIGANLRQMAAGNTNLVFTVANATNGSVALAGDGFTAQFLPATNFIGLGAFTFSASNTLDKVAFGPMTVQVFVTNAAPNIIAQPTARTNNTGETATFSVSAANAVLNYRWRKGGTFISGATNATLSLPSVTAADAASYSVVITNFSGAITSSAAVLVILTNTPPTLTAIPDRTVVAGTIIQFTNTASDTDFPPQTLTYAAQNVPAGGGVNSSNGIFYWRPTIAQGGQTNTLRMIVTDNGSPNLSATQSFNVAVLSPSAPQLWLLSPPASLSVTGSAGPDYLIHASTNLVNWTVLLTNTPTTLPFNWTDPAATNFPRRFYRIQLGP